MIIKSIKNNLFKNNYRQKINLKTYKMKKKFKKIKKINYILN
jgi:hypothetical protein